MLAGFLAGVPSSSGAAATQIMLEVTPTGASDYPTASRCAVCPTPTGGFVVAWAASDKIRAMCFAKAGTVRLLRMEWLGTALTTAGTSWTYNTLQASFAIQYTDVPEISDQDGNDVIELPWRQVYSDSQPGQIVVINENATVG